MDKGPADTIGIVIVTYNSGRWLEPCLRAIAESGRRVDQVVIVDNNSREAVQVENDIASRIGDVRVFQLSANLGFGTANNIGISHCLEKGCKYITLLNPDTKLRSDTLGELLEVFAEDRHIGIVAGIELNYGDDDYNGMSKAFCYRALSSNEDDGSFIYSRLEDGERMSGSLLMLSRETIERIGAFDPLFFMYYEDSDLLRRAIIDGVKLAICKRALYHHKVSHSYSEGGSGNTMTAAKIGQYSRSRFMYAITNPHTCILVNAVRVMVELTRGVREYYRDVALLRAFLYSLPEVPWMACVSKWRRDTAKMYEEYVTAVSRNSR